MSTEPNKPLPFPAEHSWDKDYENAGYSPVYEPLWRMLESFIESVSAETVLDFGCGDGAYADLMAEKRLWVTGIDVSGKAIEKARSRKCSQCVFIRHDCIPHDLPRDSFDIFVALNSLHCLTHDQRTRLFEQVRRVLKPNGYFFAGVLSLDDQSYPRREWREINTGTYVDDAGRLFHFFSESELDNELSWLKIQETRILQNIHPACGRKSALFVVTAQYPGQPDKLEDMQYG
jgi:SAM-dependent methyltransferase